MKRKIVDEDMPIGKLTRVPDFLPSPEELAMARESIKITISLNKGSVEFFKRQAVKHRTKYQRMIRELLDRYALRYSNK